MTTTYHPLRRLKINRSGGTFFTEVVSSSYGGGNTTVVVRDAVIIATLISVEHSIVAPRKAAAGDGSVSYEMIANKQVAQPATTYQVLHGDSVVLASGTFVVTGPVAPTFGLGRMLIVVNAGSGVITYTCYAAEGIYTGTDFVSSIILYPGQSLKLVSDGTAFRRVDLPAVSLAKANLPEGHMINGKITSAVSSNNLTVSIKTIAGNDPSASDPVYVNLAGTIRTIVAALSITLNAGTNWFNNGTATNGSYPRDYFVYLFYNSNTSLVSIGFSQFAVNINYGSFSATTTNQGYFAFTGTAPASADLVRVVGRFRVTLGVSATYYWSTPVNVISAPIFNSDIMSSTPAYSGFSSAGFTCKYRIVGVLVVVDEFEGGGSSSGSSFQVTPPILSATWFLSPCNVTEGSTYLTGWINASSSANFIVLKDANYVSLTSWAGSGAKDMNHCILTYAGLNV
jgi:hypothetical protein